MNDNSGRDADLGASDDTPSREEPPSSAVSDDDEDDVAGHVQPNRLRDRDH